MKPISQTFFAQHPSEIPARRYSVKTAGNAVHTLHQSEWTTFGTAVQLNKKGSLNAMALATPNEVFLITMEPGAALPTEDKRFSKLLAGSPQDANDAGDSQVCLLAGFEMARLALLIHRDLKLHVRGLDLSTCSSRTPKRPSEVVESLVYEHVNKVELEDLWNGGVDETYKNVCMRAWISALCAPRGSSLGRKVNTQNLRVWELDCLAELIRQEELLSRQNPRETIGEFTSFRYRGRDGVLVQNARYKTRIKKSPFAKVVMTNAEGQEFLGDVRKASGRTTSIKAAVNVSKIGTLRGIRVVGHQELLECEKASRELVLGLLQGTRQLDSPFIRKIWFPKKKAKESSPAGTVKCPQDFPLNPSQMDVVSTMISSQSLVIVHGPPGTGKTTTIAAAAAIWSVALKESVWIIAHSNVAVRNIAEKLYDKDVDFKIIVSKGFHFEWHEHIYRNIEARLIRSDNIPEDPVAMERLLCGSSVILSTLSMLSNPCLDSAGVFRLVPVKKLVIDEASQIRLFEFMSPFQKFRADLETVCFFGDPKQRESVPPYGKDKVPKMKTIFDVEHLKRTAKLLDVQYRMPVLLGEFISRHVYENKVKSQHQDNSQTCVRFVDCDKGSEAKAGLSWTNPGEIQTVAHLVRTYYRHQDFCIITPYDAQRSAIERQLKDEHLPWQSVFNVDSFQGNEADYVIVSVVRSQAPGFLTSLNRMNVMLTRCKKGLTVVSSRAFIERGAGRKTLLGKLAKHWEGLAKGGRVWLDWRLVAQGVADVPGAPGPNRDKTKTKPPTAGHCQPVTSREPVQKAEVRTEEHQTSRSSQSDIAKKNKDKPKTSAVSKPRNADNSIVVKNSHHRQKQKK